MRDVLGWCNGQPVSDVHTHRMDGNRNAVVNIEPTVLGMRATEQLLATIEQPFSLSLHPWHLDAASLKQFQELVVRYHDHPWFYAIGECGLDPCAASPMTLQQEAWRASVTMGLQLGKPVIVHCVKAWEAIMRDVRSMRKVVCGGSLSVVGQPIIVHGFRKGPELAQQLLNEGFCLSLGEHFNVQTVGVIPQDRLFCETDESALTIEIIKQNIEKYEIL